MKTYYNPKDLNRFGEVGDECPELYQQFSSWYNSVLEEGALPKKTKFLIALAVSHALQCPYCIDAHTQTSSGAGATKAEMTEAIHVAAALRGGASLVHGVQMINTLDRE